LNGRGTNRWQQAVADFHTAMELPVEDTPAIRHAELRAKLLAEECAETIAALGFDVLFSIYEGTNVTPLAQFDQVAAESLPEVIDGLVDTIYVAAGAAATMGVDLAPVFEEVHRSNMAKTGGEVREDGKRLKPPGWTPPDIAGELRKQGWQG
jgi:predicted HAD superfamily Cof-like phosphohydrolase